MRDFKASNPDLGLHEAHFFNRNRSLPEADLRDSSCGYYGYQKLVYYFGIHIPSFRVKMERFHMVNQCLRCYEYTHSTSRCTQRIQKCSLCSADHHYSICKSETLCCLLCKGDHPAISIRCPHRQDVIKNMEKSTSSTGASTSEATSQSATTSTSGFNAQADIFPELPGGRPTAATSQWGASSQTPTSDSSSQPSSPAHTNRPLNSTSDAVHLRIIHAHARRRQKRAEKNRTAAKTHLLVTPPGHWSSSTSYWPATIDPRPSSPLRSRSIASARPEKTPAQEYFLEASKKASETTQKPRKASESTRKPRKALESTQKPSKALESTQKPSKASESTQKPRKASESTQKPRKALESTQKPTKASESTQKSRKASESTQKPSKASENTLKPIKASESTQKPRKASESTQKPRKASESTQKPRNELKIISLIPGEKWLAKAVQDAAALGAMGTRPGSVNRVTLHCRSSSDMALSESGFTFPLNAN
ncbi:uncharacterized protein [Procambarus clarkii]|uniref:uncharacterized protein n=1 Tax=Procambarus clarkii TaxID=6728 RepID=UPI0037439FA0